MSICVVPGVLSKKSVDKVVFTMDWSEQMRLAIGRTIPVNDRIQSSSWAIDAGSPSSAITTPEHGFDEVSSTTWVALEGGVPGDVVHLNNTIETHGTAVNGKQTPTQRLTRQIRLRVDQC